MDCECNVGVFFDEKNNITHHIIIYCPLHESAPQLRAALKNLINHLPESEIELAREVWGNTNTRLILEYREEARQILADSGGMEE